MATLRYVFDLDDTLCKPNHEFDDTHNKYALATPIHDMITAVQILMEEGHYIIIHTARRMVTHDGDLEAIEADVGQVTRDWLAQHEVPYDELIFGKPYGDTYVDDKAMLPQTVLIGLANHLRNK